MRIDVSCNKPSLLRAQRQRAQTDRQAQRLFPGRVFVLELCLRSTVLDVRRFVHFLCGIETSILLRKNDDLIQETGMRSGRQTRQCFRDLSNLTERDEARRITCRECSALDKEVSPTVSCRGFKLGTYGAR